MFTMKVFILKTGGEKMKKAIISFVVSVVLGFGLGYLVFDVIMGNPDQQPQIAKTETKETKPAAAKNKQTKEAATTSASVSEENILNQKGCLSCHSVESLNLKGGAVGPDLSQA